MIDYVRSTEVYSSDLVYGKSLNLNRIKHYAEALRYVTHSQTCSQSEMVFLVSKFWLGFIIAGLKSQSDKDVLD